MLPTAATVFEKLPRVLRRHRLMKAWMRLTGEDSLQLVRIRDRSFGYADMSDGFLRLIVIDQDFELDFFAIADAILADGGVFFDVGANHGLFSFGLAGRHGSGIDFHLFEPNASLVASIERSLPLYPAMRCTVNAVAVSDHEGVVALLVVDGHSGASHLVASGGVPARAIMLDRYIEEARMSRVELMKIDIEGHELAAFRGARRSLKDHVIQAIYFEFMEDLQARNQPPRELLQFLDELDYQICLCRAADIAAHGGASHTIRVGLPGHGIPLVPLVGMSPPSRTDMLAIPRENLAALAG